MPAPPHSERAAPGLGEPARMWGPCQAGRTPSCDIRETEAEAGLGPPACRGEGGRRLLLQSCSAGCQSPGSEGLWGLTAGGRGTAPLMPGQSQPPSCRPRSAGVKAAAGRGPGTQRGGGGGGHGEADSGEKALLPSPFPPRLSGSPFPPAQPPGLPGQATADMHGATQSLEDGNDPGKWSDEGAGRREAISSGMSRRRRKHNRTNIK